MEKDGEKIHKPIFQSVQLVTKGAAEGCARVFFVREDLDVRKVVHNMSHEVVAWFAGYLLKARKNKK